MNGVVERRIDELERKLRSLESELREVRALAVADKASRDASEWFADESGLEAALAKVEPEPVPPAAPYALPPARLVESPSRAARAGRPKRRQIDLAGLLGAKALAWAGGVVTLLGIVFFFVLAVDRGWIGPDARVALGGAASMLVLLAGIELRRRYGHLHSVFAAVGAGIAGAYATLLAATALYEFVPHWLALALAGVVAGTGLALSLVWRSEFVAGFGLIGAMFVPALLAFQGGMTTIGTVFVAIVFAATAVVGVDNRWRALLIVGLVTAVVQIAAFLVAESSTGPGTVVVASAFWLLFLGTGIAYKLRLRPCPLDALATGFLLASGGFALYAARFIFGGGLAQGTALLVAGFVYGLLATAFFPREEGRDLSALLTGLALAVGAVGVADLVSGGTLTYVWSAEASLLAWLSLRLREVRLQLGALAYLAAAAVHAVLFEAGPEHLFRSAQSPGSGIPSVLALAAATGIVAVCAKQWKGEAVGEEGVFRPFAPLLAGLRRGQDALRIGAAAGSALLTVYALSLGVLAFFQLGGDPLRFAHAHAVVSGMWGLVGLLVLIVGLRRGLPALQTGALAWLGATLVKVLLFDTSQFGPTDRSYSFLAVALSVFLSGFLLQRLGSRSRRSDVVAAIAATVSVGLTLVAVATLVDETFWGIDLRGLAFLGIAAVCAGFATIVLRIRRDYATQLWTIALVVAAGAEPRLFGGQWLVGVWAVSSVALAWLSVKTEERRLQFGSLAYLVLGLVAMLATTAPFDDLFIAGEHPGSGAPSAILVALATLLCGRISWGWQSEPADRLDRQLDSLRIRARTISLWSAGAIGLYALSLSILELFELIRPGSVESSFQSGHTLVSAAWGLLGLGLLYLGLRRRVRSLQLAGFALFGVSLGKLFLYDLAQLSSITRALSFLAVGGVLLLGGFFYQRLTSQSERRRVECGT
jgi:uncharacterized membrane protein